MAGGWLDFDLAPFGDVAITFEAKAGGGLRDSTSVNHRTPKSIRISCLRQRMAPRTADLSSTVVQLAHVCLCGYAQAIEF